MFRCSLHRSVARGVIAGLIGLACLGSATAQAQTLVVSAAASLTNVLKSISTDYEASHPGVKLQFNFAASGVLIQQIAEGAPVDIFISADEETMAKGIAHGDLDAATRRDIASNQVVLIVPSTPASEVSALADLKRAAVSRIAIGKLASVPVGRYTRESLERAGLWSALEPKLVYADSVRQVLDYVARGEVEAGFVYATDATVMPDKVHVVMRVEGHSPVRYPVALTRDAAHKPAAQAFEAFLLSPTAQAALTHAGFGPP